MHIAGKVQSGYILLWNFSDPIHPQFVLEAPGDVYCFRFCPNNPDLVVGGVSSGQVCVWNLAEARNKAREQKALTDETVEEGMQSITAQAICCTATASTRFPAPLPAFTGHNTLGGRPKSQEDNHRPLLDAPVV